jgi:hypothetical protein
LSLGFQYFLDELENAGLIYFLIVAMVTVLYNFPFEITMTKQGKIKFRNFVRKYE